MCTEWLHNRTSRSALGTLLHSSSPGTTSTRNNTFNSILPIFVALSFSMMFFFFLNHSFLFPKLQESPGNIFEALRIFIYKCIQIIAHFSGRVYEVYCIYQVNILYLFYEYCCFCLVSGKQVPNVCLPC